LHILRGPQARWPNLLSYSALNLILVSLGPSARDQRGLIVGHARQQPRTTIRMR